MHGTIFHGKQAAVELVVRVLACLAEGLGIRARARVFEVDANTVLNLNNKVLGKSGMHSKLLPVGQHRDRAPFYTELNLRGLKPRPSRVKRKAADVPLSVCENIWSSALLETVSANG
jgi:hypothetical protein